MHWSRPDNVVTGLGIIVQDNKNIMGVNEEIVSNSQQSRRR